MTPTLSNKGDALPIVGKLRATEMKHRVTMLGHVYDKVPVNPDGPEAADTIIALHGALDALDTFCRSGEGNADELLNKTGAALSLVRGEVLG